MSAETANVVDAEAIVLGAKIIAGAITVATPILAGAVVKVGHWGYKVISRYIDIHEEHLKEMRVKMFETIKDQGTAIANGANATREVTDRVIQNGEKIDELGKDIGTVRLMLQKALGRGHQRKPGEQG